MKANEIMEKLQNGAEITKSEHMKFKYKKLVRGGTTYSYSIDGQTISKTQFEKIEHLLTRTSENVFGKTYKLKQ